MSAAVMGAWAAAAKTAAILISTIRGTALSGINPKLVAAMPTTLPRRVPRRSDGAKIPPTPPEPSVILVAIILPRKRARSSVIGRLVSAIKSTISG
jgi:hypothetical protein